MARKKQRKSAYIPPAHEVENRKERSVRSRTLRRGGSTARSSGGGRGRELEPPTWRRALRRAPLYYLLFFGLQYVVSAKQKDAAGHLLSKSERFEAAGVLAAVMVLAFIPMMVMMERLQYARWLKNRQKQAGSESRRSDA